MKLRPYQSTITQEQEKWFRYGMKKRASIYAPTGSGKTVVFTHLVNTINSMFANTKTGYKILICHPRLALSIDQQSRMIDDLDGLVEFTSFHSGEVKQHSDGRVRQNKAIIDPDTLDVIIDECTDNHITFTSYRSLHKIADKQFDLIICDEAHYLVQPKLRENLHLFTSKAIFYTATPLEVEVEEQSGTNFGMENVKLFGTPIAKVLPKELLKLGYIVPPRILQARVTTSNPEAEMMSDPVETIASVYIEQRDLFYSESSNKLKYKMLTAMSNTLSFEHIMENLIQIRQMTGNNDLDLYYVTGQYHYKNGNPMPSREMLLDDFAKSKNEAIIIHCDTLAEGIDVDGLLGCFVFRRLSKSKLIQTLGRCGRPSKLDLIDGEPCDFDDRLKKFFVVTLAIIDDTTVTKDANTWIRAFAEGGYEDITDYLEVKDLISSKKGEGDDDIIFARVEDIKTNEIENDMYHKLFLTGCTV